MKFITLSSKGYLGLTSNCIKSLRLYGAPVPDVYYVGDDNPIFDGELIMLPDNSRDNIEQWGTAGFKSLVKYKFDIIHRNLMGHEYVLYIDGDITFESADFVNYIESNMNDSLDMLIQNDTMSDDDCSNLCSGFMFIRRTERTLDLFKPNIARTGSDQNYINLVKGGLKYKLLPLNLFPNGAFFYKNHTEMNPYLIHFNWIFGSYKESAMRNYKKWYLRKQFI